MAKGPTIQEVKKNKIKLEQEILELIKKFESDNGVYAGYINIQRDHEDSLAEAPTKMEKKGAVKNVEVSMDLDLIY
jgi:hypothetical protein